MIEYTIIGYFNYDNKKYEMLIDDKHKYFFLKIKNNGKYDYVTIQELLKLTNLFYHDENIQLIEDKKKKSKKLFLVPKVIVGTVLVTLTISFLSHFNINHNKYVFDLSQPATKNVQYTEIISTTNEKVDKDETQIAVEKALKEIEEETEKFKVEDIQEGIRLKIIYDNSKLDEILNNTKDAITYDMIREIITNNSKIPQKYKEIYLNLANNLEKKYPDMDLRVWYQNLKSLAIVELDEMSMKVKAVSVNAYACYRKDENTIYTVKDYNYEPGTWEYQVIIHEMCHPIRTSHFKVGDEEIRVQFQNRSGEGTIIDEAMNSILSLRSYDKNEKDIAYQLQSNMVEAILDSMSNYTLKDYVEHNISYFENELNIENNDNRAVEMIGLLTLQYEDYHNDKIKVDQETFYPLYDYIARMYYSKRIDAQTSYESAIKIRDELIERITYDVPEEYNIDINHFNEYFDNYCMEQGILNEKHL